MNAVQVDHNKEVVTLGGGCFWCTEAVFKSIEGVLKVEPGYSGGKPEDANYGRVSTGRTGHVEVVQVTFDS
jgi:peptide-methionine (S)-S-oxide reductase